MDEISLFGGGGDGCGEVTDDGGDGCGVVTDDCGDGCGDGDR